MPLFIKSICIFLICICASQISAQAIIPDERIIDYECSDKRFRNVLFELSEISSVTIAWQDQLIPSDSLVSLKFNQAKLSDVLIVLLEPHDLMYKIVGGHITIVKDPLSGIGPTVTLSGYITDAETGESLVNAHLYTLANNKITFSNEYGFYSFTLPKGKQSIYISYVGYERFKQELFLKADTTLDISMQPSSYLREVLISDKEYILSPEYNDELASVYQIPLNRLNRSVSLAGESDIFRTAIASAGVSTGADGFGGMSIRGGSENQNLVLLDGIPVYSSNHAFGLFSIFNSSVIKSAKLYKGTMPAHYSGRLSSVMDIRTREGNSKEFQGHLGLGLFTSKISLEGPIKKDRSSFLISARRTFVDPWLLSATKALNKRIGKEGGTDFSFYDLNAKLNFKVADHSRLYFSFYSGSDYFNYDVSSFSENQNTSLTDQSQIIWNTGNTLASVKLNTKLSQKLFSNVKLFLSEYSFDAFDHDRLVSRNTQSNEWIYSEFEAGYYKSAIQDLGLRLEFDYIPSSEHMMKFGLSRVDHDFSPGLVLADEDDGLVSGMEAITNEILSNRLSDPEVNAKEWEFFFSDEINLSPRSRINIGYNHLLINSQGRTYSIAQPRILFSTEANNYRFKASWGQMGQFLHSLLNTGLGMPIDVWLPSTENLAPETSWMITNGHFIRTENIGVFGLELFYKEMDQLTRYTNNTLLDISADSNWDRLLPVGRGYSYGTELSYEKNSGKTNFNFSYTLSWSYRKFEDINNGEAFRFRYDRRHIINASLLHRVTPDIDLSINWHFGSGAPITIPTGSKYFDRSQEDGSSELVIIYKGVNNAVLPHYHRLDIGFNFRHDYGWGDSVFSIGLYNAYNRQNTFFRDVTVDLSDANRPIRFEDVTLLPVLPSLSYSLNF